MGTSVKNIQHKLRPVMLNVAVIVAIGATSLLSGCASIAKGTKDVLQVNIANCNEAIECTATNKKGTYGFTAPGPVKFKKSDDNLIIVCKDGDDDITMPVTPTRGGMVWGNIVFGGFIGGGVDAVTDAHWDMADAVTLHRTYCKGERAQ